MENSGNTALMYCCDKNDKHIHEVISLLIQHKDIDVNLRNSEGTV